MKKQDNTKRDSSFSILGGLAVLALLTALLVDSLRKGDVGMSVFLAICIAADLSVLYAEIILPRLPRKKSTVSEAKENNQPDPQPIFRNTPEIWNPDSPVWDTHEIPEGFDCLYIIQELCQPGASTPGKLCLYHRQIKSIDTYCIVRVCNAGGDNSRTFVTRPAKVASQANTPNAVITDAVALALFMEPGTQQYQWSARYESLRDSLQKWGLHCLSCKHIRYERDVETQLAEWMFPVKPDVYRFLKMSYVGYGADERGIERYYTVNIPNSQNMTAEMLREHWQQEEKKLSEAFMAKLMVQSSAAQKQSKPEKKEEQPQAEGQTAAGKAKKATAAELREAISAIVAGHPHEAEILDNLSFYDGTVRTKVTMPPYHCAYASIVQEENGWYVACGLSATVQRGRTQEFAVKAMADRMMHLDWDNDPELVSKVNKNRSHQRVPH